MKINKREKQAVLKIYRSLGKDRIAEYVHSKYDESRKLKKLLKYNPSKEVENRIEFNLLSLYGKVANWKKIHPLEQLVRDWNSRNNFVLKRSKIFDIEAFQQYQLMVKQQMKLSLDNMLREKYVGQTYESVKIDLKLKKKVFEKILQRRRLKYSAKKIFGENEFEILKDYIKDREIQIVEIERKRIEEYNEKIKQYEADEKRRAKSDAKERNWQTKHHDKFDKTRPIYTGMID